MSLAGVGAVLVMFVAIFLIPLGLPGIWVMVAVVGLGTLLAEVSAGILMVTVALAAVAELAEFLILRGMSKRYGGSARAFWGAVFGGLAGVIIGMPIPVIGPVIAGILGSFIGAAALALHESGDIRSAGRVGWGVVLARVLAAVMKVGAAIVILVLGGTAWLIR